jgi:hypothetical protein
MSPTRRERKNPELEAKLIEYRQWARTYAEIERFTAHFSHLGFGLQGVPVPC